MDRTELHVDDQTFRLTVITLLAEIRDLLTHGVQAAEADDDLGCPHPDDKRVSLATAAEPDHWVCCICKYDHRGVVHN